jgi:dephospho-CoA kinase
MPFIGLTGNLGMGKTTVLRAFKSLGARTISADDIVHKILKTPQIRKKLVSVLGSNILTKKTPVTIDKKRMADIIFNDSRKLRSAEKIIHPEVIKTAKKIKAEILSKKPDAVIVFEAPLLFEAGLSRLFDKIIVVYCSEAAAINRTVKAGLSKEQALKRMRSQMPISKKKAAADFLINNSSKISNLKPRIAGILKKLTVS